MKAILIRRDRKRYPIPLSALPLQPTGATENLVYTLFNEVIHTDDHAQTRSWSVADTVVDLPLATTTKTGEVFSIRQISRTVAATGGGTRQIHILTTDHAMSAGEVVYRMGSRWRQENQFRYARMHACTST